MLERVSRSVQARGTQCEHHRQRVLHTAVVPDLDAGTVAPQRKQPAHPRPVDEPPATGALEVSRSRRPVISKLERCVLQMAPMRSICGTHTKKKGAPRGALRNLSCWIDL